MSLKKHRRSISTCERCRIRKIKCDKSAPCLKCIKEGVHCSLEGDHFSLLELDNSVNTDGPPGFHETGEPEWNLLNYCLSSHEKISFFLTCEDANKVGPLSMDFLELKDPLLHILRVKNSTSTRKEGQSYHQEYTMDSFLLISLNKQDNEPTLLETLLKPLKVMDTLNGFLPSFGDIWLDTDFFLKNYTLLCQ